jgi:molecular chaperone DnaJ
MAATKDYYSILGITEDEKKLSEDEFQKVLKTKYRTLSKQKHPDIGGNEDEFKEIAESYETLSDKNKRAQYENQKNNPYNGTQFQDIFSQMFGGNPFGNMGGHNQRKRAPDKIIKININPIESYRGSEKIINYLRDNHCGVCGGTGGQQQTCGTCNGAGFQIKTFGTGFMVQHIRTACQSCGGRGYTLVHKCYNCDGRGVKQSPNEIRINIPVGSDNGQFFKLQNLGDFYDGEYGDLVIQVELTEKDGFEKINNDLIYNLYLNLQQIQNDKFSIPHPDGDLNVSSPKTVDTSKPLRLRGKGYNGGDMYVKLHVKFDRTN